MTRSPLGFTLSQMNENVKWTIGRLYLAILLASSCYNPLNAVTSDRYRQQCFEADDAGRLDVAEEACRRALINVRIGHLGADAESQELYNLGKIKRKLGKFTEAEELYKESLRVQESISPLDEIKVGRRLAELATVHGLQNKFDEGLPYVMRLLPIADRYSGDERKTVAVIFGNYAVELRKKNSSPDSARLLAARATEMGFDSKRLSKLPGQLVHQVFPYFPLNSSAS